MRPQADLAAYAGSYLQQEIVAEGATRNVPAFSRFLRVAAHGNGTIVNFTNIANDAQVPRTTVLSYWRSTSGFEVDFILGDHTGIEMKAKDTRPSPRRTSSSVISA